MTAVVAILACWQPHISGQDDKNPMEYKETTRLFPKRGDQQKSFWKEQKEEKKAEF